MANELKVKRINIKEYDISKWKQLLDILHPVASKIFVIKRAALAKSIFYQNSSNTNLYLFFRDKKVVGFNLVNIYEYNYKGSDYSFFRFTSGLLPKYRGQSNVQKIGFVEAFRYAASHPLRKIFYLGPLIHPSSYAVACKVSNKVYPSLKQPEVPKKYFDLMVTVADILGFEKVEGESPLIRDTKITTLEDENYVPKRISNRAKFFMDLNPNYTEGYGLVTMVPMSFKNVSESFMKYYARVLKIPKMKKL